MDKTLKSKTLMKTCTRQEEHAKLSLTSAVCEKQKNATDLQPLKSQELLRRFSQDISTLWCDILS